MNVFKKLGLWYILATPVLAGLSTFELKADTDGFTVTGLIWVAQFAVGLLILPFVWSSDDHRGDLTPWWPWFVWAGWAWMTLLWCDNLSRRNVQETIQLCMPILVGMIAVSVIRSRTDLRWLLSSFHVTFVLLAAFTLVFLSGKFDEEWISTRVRPAALTMTLVGCVYIAGYPRRKIWPIVGWGACVLLTLLSQSRMATMTLLVAPICFPLYRRKSTNVLAALALAAVAVGLFYTPIVQKKFFESGSGKLSEAFEGDYAGAGRFEAWPEIWREAWTHPALGAGVGSAYDFVPLVWEDINHVHNDYLRVFFEMGIIGEMIFVTTMIWQLVVLYRRTQTTRGLTRSAFVAAFLGWCALLISCATDNTILYNIYYTDLLFAIIGGAYGVLAASTSGGHAPAADTAKMPELRPRNFRPV